MGIIPENIKAKVGGHFLKAEEFANGLELEVVGFEVMAAKDPKYGATEVDWLFKSDKLKKGETFKYTFKTIVGHEDLDVAEDKVFESKSAPFFIAFSQIDPEVGDKVLIKREGEGTKTTYKITKVV